MFHDASCGGIVALLCSSKSQGCPIARQRQEHKSGKDKWGSNMELHPKHANEKILNSRQRAEKVQQKHLPGMGGVVIYLCNRRSPHASLTIDGCSRSSHVWMHVNQDVVNKVLALGCAILQAFVSLLAFGQFRHSTCPFCDVPL